MHFNQFLLLMRNSIYVISVKHPFKSIVEEMLTAGIDNEGVLEEINTFITAVRFYVKIFSV